MGEASAEIKEIRFVFEDKLTQVYFFYWGRGDVPIGVTGWHHKTFPESTSALDILEAFRDGKEQPLLWALGGPSRD